jgi:hypothetical protein
MLSWVTRRSETLPKVALPTHKLFRWENPKKEPAKEINPFWLLVPGV